MSANENKAIGVIIVSYSSSDVIVECLKSLELSDFENLNIVVCDNASPDSSNELIREFANQQAVEFEEVRPVDFMQSDQVAPKRLTLVSIPENLGYAGGVNVGIDYFLKCEDIEYFWVLNPDCTVQPDTASAYIKCADNAGEVGLMSGRTLYHGEGGMIQSDGGWVNLWNGICTNLNFGLMQSDVNMPDPNKVNFLLGANLIATRNFVDKVGKMCEDYFLYYEEVDWAMRRGTLPLVLCPDAVVLHHAGTSIGSGTMHRRHSAFSNYFNYRNRMRFVRKFRPIALPFAYTYSLLKVIRLVLSGAMDEASGAWRGLNNQPPPKSVAERLDETARIRAFASGPP